MSITNGQPIEALDLGSMLTTSLAAIQADNAQLPLGHHLALHFHGVVAGTAEYRRKAIFVLPFDCYLESLSLQASEMTAASTTTARLTGNGATWPATVSATTGAGLIKATRLLYDGTKGRADATAEPTSRAFRLLAKGATVTVAVETTSVAAASTCTVALCLRSFLARE